MAFRFPSRCLADTHSPTPSSKIARSDRQRPSKKLTPRSALHSHRQNANRTRHFQRPEDLPWQGASSCSARRFGIPPNIEASQYIHRRPASELRRNQDEIGLIADGVLVQGKLYVRGDSKIFRFQRGKSESLFLQRKNPRRIAWTVLFRRAHKKGISEVRWKFLPGNRCSLQEEAYSTRKKVNSSPD